jgi:hypothetical protein
LPAFSIPGSSNRALRCLLSHRYGQDRRDVILNPLDARCPAWSLFDECRTGGASGRPQAQG